MELSFLTFLEGKLGFGSCCFIGVGLGLFERCESLGCLSIMNRCVLVCVEIVVEI